MAYDAHDAAPGPDPRIAVDDDHLALAHFEGENDSVSAGVFQGQSNLAQVQESKESKRARMNHACRMANSLGGWGRWRIPIVS